MSTNEGDVGAAGGNALEITTAALAAEKAGAFVEACRLWKHLAEMREAWAREPEAAGDASGKRRPVAWWTHWFTDAELLAFRDGTILAQVAARTLTPQSPPIVRASAEAGRALYLEVCAAIDARPSLMVAGEARPLTSDNRLILCCAPLKGQGRSRCTLPAGHAGAHARDGEPI